LLHFWSLLRLWSIRLIFQFLDHYTDGKTHWMGDQIIRIFVPGRS
jgi:hypothetical protein